MAIVSRLFSISPRVSKQGGRLIASPSWRMQVLTLGFGHKRVVVDPQARVVLIQSRKFWLFTSRRRIPFHAVAAVIYAYHDAGFSLSWAYDTTDVFIVALRLRDGSEPVLFRFFGAGEFVNEGPYPDWFYSPDAVFDEVGTQENESRAYVEVLSRMIGVHIESRS